MYFIASSEHNISINGCAKSFALGWSLLLGWSFLREEIERASDNWGKEEFYLLPS
jgi:hypothetical protein